MSSFLKFYNEETSLKVGSDENGCRFEIHDEELDYYFNVILSYDEIDELVEFLTKRKKRIVI